jgi:hypothetical protein
MSKPIPKPMSKPMPKNNINKFTNVNKRNIKNDMSNIKTGRIGGNAKPPLYPKNPNINKPIISKIQINNEEEMVRLLTPEVKQQNNIIDDSTNIEENINTIPKTPSKRSSDNIGIVKYNSPPNTTEFNNDTKYIHGTVDVSHKKRKNIDIIRDNAKLSQNSSRQSIPSEIRERKVKEKIYVELFRKYAVIDNKYKSIVQGDVDPNELVVCLNLPEDTDITKFQVGMHFDRYDDIKTIIITDKAFYKGLFYSEVIQTGRYKEAWHILRQRYKMHQWIDRYIYFLLHAQSIIPLLIE